MTTTQTAPQDARGPVSQPTSSAPDPALARAYRRILRRETHSSRSGAAIVVLILLMLSAADVGVEAVYAGLGLHALLFSPVDVLRALLTAATGQSGIVFAAGIVAAVVGVILVIIGLTPGRRGRHTIDDDRIAVVVDDQVIAASLARRARLAGALAPGQVNAWVARTSARITLTPASGVMADEEAVLEAARHEIASAGYRPRIEPRVSINRTGKLGA